MSNLTWRKKDIILDYSKNIPFRFLDEKFDFGEGENMLIQGDNLEALTSLLPYYGNSIKCIYIDPPYNTGKENWIYNDNVNSPVIKKWLNEKVGRESEDLSRHEKWLCMMYPRLLNLWKLLKDNGVIFVSIDDNEMARLKLLMDDIFGPQNFIETLIWNTEGHTDNQKTIKVNHEYILVYAKNKSQLKLNKVIDPNTRDESNLHKGYAENSITKNGAKNPPSIITLPIGFPCAIDELNLESSNVPEEFFKEVEAQGYISADLTKKYSTEYPIRLDAMKVRNGELIEPCRVFTGWSSATKLKNYIKLECTPLEEEDGEKMYFYLSKKGVIYYRKERDGAQNILSVLRNMGTTELMKSELERMGITFDYPKPKQLISYLLSLATDEGDIILDSFAGSGTTGHATLMLNKEDQKNRKFILIELEEHIANGVITKRLESVISGYEAITKKGNKVPVEPLGGGYKYYELGDYLYSNGQLNSNIKYEQLARIVFYSEAKKGLDSFNVELKPLVGSDDAKDIYLLLDDEILNVKFIKSLDLESNKQKIIYAESCTLSEETLNRFNITFKQLPYELRLF